MTAYGAAHIDASQSVFGGASGSFDGTAIMSPLPTARIGIWGAGFHHRLLGAVQHGRDLAHLRRAERRDHHFLGGVGVPAISASVTSPPERGG